MKYELEELMEEVESELVERFKRKYPDLSDDSLSMLSYSRIRQAIGSKMMTTEQKKQALYKLMKEI